jgi:hypothetical protein
VERDKAQSGPPRLQQLELLAQDDKELATLDGYTGGLAVSPQGHRVAYFIDNEVLELRDISHPALVARLRVGFGAIVHWSPDETTILVKRAPEKKSGDIVSINVPELTDPRAYPDSGPARTSIARFCHLPRRSLPGSRPARQTQSPAICLFSMNVTMVPIGQANAIS